MLPKKQRAYCKPCKRHWTDGVKGTDGKNWCCEFGQAARTVIGHCLNVGGKQEKEND